MHKVWVKTETERGGVTENSFSWSGRKLTALSESRCKNSEWMQLLIHEQVMTSGLNKPQKGTIFRQLILFQVRKYNN